MTFQSFQKAETPCKIIDRNGKVLHECTSYRLAEEWMFREFYVEELRSYIVETGTYHVYVKIGV